jgi:hypothetical protein
MKFFVLVWTAAFSLMTWAAPDSEVIKRTLLSAPSCGNFVRFDDANIYLGFGPYRTGLDEPRPAIPGEVDVLPLNGGPLVQLATLDSAVDSVGYGDDLFVLTYTGLEQWNLKTAARTAVYPTSLLRGPLLYKQHAEAMARFKDKLILAHGRLGVSFFNLRSKKITRQLPLVTQPAPRESMATGVTVQGQYAYVGLDNFTLGDGAFRGLVVIDMESETVVATLPGLDAGVDALASDAQTLIASFSGMPIWRYSLPSIDLGASTLPEPAQRVWQFPEKGSPTGRPAIDAKYYYTCYWRPTSHGQYSSQPAVLERKAVGL